MLRHIRRAVLRLQQGSGIFHLVADSKWRKNRLLILCYHGISRYDEHLWRPNSYMYPEVLRQRLEILKHGCYNVLSLGEGLRRLQAGELPWLRFLRGRFSSHKELWISCHCLSNNLLRRLSEAGF